MKYCPYCGADLIEDAVSFCAECGKQLPAGKPQKEKSKEKPEIKKIAIIIGVLFVVIIACVALMYVL